METPSSQPQKKRHSPFYTVLIFFEVIFLVGLGVGFYMFFVPNNPITQWWKGRGGTSEVKLLTEKIGALVLLPTGETPTVATVSDRAKLQSQPFFAHAENGDKVLIFSEAKKAFLYRPSINKIIEIAPINFSQPGQVPSTVRQADAPVVTAVPVAASASAAPISVAIYNASKTGDSTAAVEQLLKDKAPNVSVASRTKATLSYTKNLVIDLRGTNREMAGIIANMIGGEVSAMPSGEAVPKTPLLIILGK